MVLFFALKLGLATLGLLICPLQVLKALVTADPFTDRHGKGSQIRGLTFREVVIHTGVFLVFLGFFFFFLPPSLPHQ